MRRKKKKRGADEQLLDAIVALENEWKQIQAIVEKSIEPTEDIFYRQNIARENYLFCCGRPNGAKLVPSDIINR